ncbi:AMP-binding protein, partial [Xanthomonas sp. 3498]|uniref:AMP-binding protein n=1 Tax=Xanthomonas sp. 3498 TaxID=2663863 RepID=UPI00161D0B34
PFGFDVSVWEFFWPLLNGATLALAPPGAHKDPDALAALFVHHGVTTAHFVPSMLALFLQTPGVERCTTLRHLVCSGEALPASSVRLAQRRLPWTALHNLYGPTEAAIDVTAWTCPPAFAGESVPIGRPIANTTIYLLDGNGQPVPLGAVGELHIGGVGVARGYLNRPQLTAERFLPDPFAADPEARLYRTGDLARYRADGAIEFLGRIDHQVKLRGFRIELGEIEARIAEHPAVHSTVVLALGEAAHMRLVAYVVPRETPADAPSDALVTTLRTFLARTLPDYMVPAAFVCLPALPLNANGKLDRKALPAPQDDAFARHAYAPPHPGTEAILAEAWCRLLGRERIGRHDQFFALGGNSLLAVRLLSRIEAACGVRLSLAEVFAHPTLRELAHAVTRHQNGAATASLPAIVPVHHGDTLPLSFAQQRLWFLAQLEGTGTAYHMPGALRLRGDLDPLALRRALDALLQRHAALRTVFATSADGQPLAHLLPAGQAFPLVEHDLGLQPDQAAAIARLALDEVLAPFDLARGPLIRGRLLRLGQADHVLLITQHHIVSDGWSLGILINELG